MDIRDVKYKEKILSYFVNKNRLIKLLLDECLSKRYENKPLKILSLGCGTGEELKVLSDYGEVYAIDIDSNVLNFVDRSLCKKIKICDVCKIEFEDNFFDIVVGFDILEHIEDDTKAAEEIYRVLKPKGKFVFTVPAFQFIFSSHDVVLGHKRRYNKKMLKSLFLSFKIKQMFFYQYILFPFMIIFRILRKKSKNIDLKVVPKICFEIINSISQVELFLIKLGVKFKIFGLTLCGIVEKI
ncbi:MAG: class I SAM-dependent methyltransferase [Endomicrobia bacterium]|nr:class I SAM-dependent methyltransferase [Endomicrobiia bacterium]MDW8055622.1 class I SAM-dependent methyltransferase [Elusimicrobiota bacterium]